MRKENNIKNRIGEIKIMNCGEECEIVEYTSYKDIAVKFLKTGELIKSRYDHFKRGVVRSHFTPTVYGVGVIGLENTVSNDVGKLYPSYITWSNMLQRCYDKKLKDKYSTYSETLVCEEWLYYKNFKKWYDYNYYEIEGQRMDLDKDILVKNNNIYSPENCVFVPQFINSLFVKCNSTRGEYPVGVHWHKQKQKFQSRCSVFDTQIKKSKVKHLGYFNTPEEAFSVYKQFKENYIKQVADYYKNRIPKKLYEAMYKYEVHIDD